MANYYFVMAVFVMALVACKCEADLISEVCEKARNPTTCNRALRSDPRSKLADLRGLAEIMIRKSQAGIRVAKMVAKAVESSENKATIETCLETQKEGTGMLSECRALVRSSGKVIDKETLNIKASAAMTYVANCDDGFEDTGMQEPAVLLQASQNAQDMISVLLHISTLL